MTYNDQNKIARETENLSSDEQNVARLLSGLKRVEAPKDFDFHLKARIANASPGDHRPVRFFPVLRYALPLVLFLVAGGAFVLDSSYGGGDVPVVADSANVSNPMPDVNTIVLPKAIDPASVPVNDDIVAETDPDTSEQQSQKNVIKTTRRLRSNGSNSPNAPGAGSVDFRAGPGGSYVMTGNKAREPRRFNNSNGSSTNSNSSGKPGGIVAQPLELRQVLRTLGIEADFEEKGWRVRVLTKNGIGEQSGLRPGDLMEAIDDKPISTLYDGRFAATSISVRRGDEVHKIDVRGRRP